MLALIKWVLKIEQPYNNLRKHLSLFTPVKSALFQHKALTRNFTLFFHRAILYVNNTTITYKLTLTLNYTCFNQNTSSVSSSTFGSITTKLSGNIPWRFLQTSQFMKICVLFDQVVHSNICTLIKCLFFLK